MKAKKHWTDTIELVAGALAIVFVLLALSSMSYGQEQEVRLITATGEQGINCQMSESLFDNVAEIFKKETGIKLVLKSKSCLPNPFVQTLQNRQEVINNWFDLLPRRRNLLTIVVVPPIEDDMNFYVAGMALKKFYVAGNFIKRQKFILVNAKTPIQKDGLEHRNYALSLYASLHEIGHAFTARHDNDSINIMHQDALIFVDSEVPLKFTNKSLREIR